MLRTALYIHSVPLHGPNLVLSSLILILGRQLILIFRRVIFLRFFLSWNLDSWRVSLKHTMARSTKLLPWVRLRARLAILPLGLVVLKVMVSSLLSASTNTPSIILMAFVQVVDAIAAPPSAILQNGRSMKASTPKGFNKYKHLSYYHHN